MLIDTLFNEFRNHDETLEEKLRLPEVQFLNEGDSFSVRKRTVSFKYLLSPYNQVNLHYSNIRIKKCIVKLFEHFQNELIIPLSYPDKDFLNVQVTHNNYKSLVYYANYMLMIEQFEDESGIIFSFTLKTLYKS